MKVIHYGAQGVATMCGISPLLASDTTFQTDTVDCTKCLWCLMQQMLEGVDKLCNRIRLVTDERMAEVHIARA